MIDIGKQKVEVNCPNCKKDNQVTLAQVSKEETIKCSGCNQSIQFQDQDNSVKNGIRNGNKVFKNLENALKNLGR
jgi:transposase-like protein